MEKAARVATAQPSLQEALRDSPESKAAKGKAALADVERVSTERRSRRQEEHSERQRQGEHRAKRWRRRASVWLSRARDGYCQATSKAGNCSKDSLGTWALDPAASHERWTWESAAALCLEKCSSCARCRVVSLSPLWRDCSWHAACGLDGLKTDVKGFKTAPAAVRLRRAMQLRRVTAGGGGASGGATGTEIGVRVAVILAGTLEVAPPSKWRWLLGALGALPALHTCIATTSADATPLGELPRPGLLLVQHRGLEVSDWRLAEIDLQRSCYAALREFERQAFVEFKVFGVLRADMHWMGGLSPLALLRPAIRMLAVEAPPTVLTADSEHYRGINDRIALMSADAAPAYFGRGWLVERGWNDSMHQSTEGLLLHALEGMQRLTFPTLAAVGCCAGRRCAAFQARQACSVLCALGEVVRVKYRHEAWAAASNAAALRDSRRSLVRCPAGLPIAAGRPPPALCIKPPAARPPHDAYGYAWNGSDSALHWVLEGEAKHCAAPRPETRPRAAGVLS